MARMSLVPRALVEVSALVMVHSGAASGSQTVLEDAKDIAAGECVGFQYPLAIEGCNFTAVLSAVRLQDGCNISKIKCGNSALHTVVTALEVNQC